MPRPLACPTRSLVSLMGKRFGRSLLKGRPAHRRCSNRADAVGASTRSRRTPTLACLFPRRGRTAGTDPAPMPDPGITQSGLQTRGWCASGRGSLAVVGIAAPDRSPFKVRTGTKRKSLGNAWGTFRGLQTKPERRAIYGLKLGGSAPSRPCNSI